MKLNLIQLIYLLFVPCLLLSQSNTAIGEWKSYLPLNNGKQIDTGDGKIFVAADLGLIIIEEQDLSFQTFTKVEGLSGVSVEGLSYDAQRKQLLIYYEDSSIDLFTPESTFEVLDIKLNGTVSGSKKINDIHVPESGSFAYIATDFGIIQYNLDRREFGFTSFTDESIYESFLIGDNLFLATESGTYFLDLSGPLNPSDFNNWTYVDEGSGMPPVYRSDAIAFINESIYLNADNQIFKSVDGSEFSLVYEFDDSELSLSSIKKLSDHWAITLKHNSGKSEIHFFDFEDNLIFEETGCPDVTNDIVEDGTGRLWISDQWSRVRYKDSATSECQYISYNGPNSALLSDVQVYNDIIYVASGGVSDNFTYNFSNAGMYIFRDNEWVNLNESTYSPINENNLLNIFQVLPHPDGKRLFVGTYWAGVFEYGLEDGSFSLFNKDNTSLQGAVGDEARTRIAAMTFDRDNNLWLGNYAAAAPLAVMTKEGIWHSFEVESSSSIAAIVIDDLGTLWMRIAGNNGGLLIYDIGENIEDPTDDDQQFLNANNSELPTNQIKSIAKDLDGDIWVGTTEGVVVFECGASALDDECDGTQPRVLQDSIVGFLLGTEEVQSILIDGANRKWFGTKNGLFLQSANGEDQLAHFTESNSPLFDNDVIDLAYNEENGELMIGTAKGLQSLRTGSTGASVTHSSEIYAFPNPVYSGYTGEIAIKGLARNADIKITDLNGKLIFETTALGGQALWDGRDYNGKDAAGGVYLVFSSSVDVFRDPDAAVTKILLMR